LLTSVKSYICANSKWLRPFFKHNKSNLCSQTLYSFSTWSIRAILPLDTCRVYRVSLHMALASLLPCTIFLVFFPPFHFRSLSLIPDRTVMKLLL
jgi:hypothetical protein